MGVLRLASGPMHMLLARTVRDAMEEADVVLHLLQNDLKSECTEQLWSAFECEENLGVEFGSLVAHAAHSLLVYALGILPLKLRRSQVQGSESSDARVFFTLSFNFQRKGLTEGS